jgi:membrane protein DedA with SNARE-associated domain
VFDAFVSWLVQTIGHMGYPGIVGLMFLESSFFPFPSEVVVPPAGFLAARGQMNLILVIGSGILGSILGALFNYWLSLRFGRPLFLRYGRYFLVSEKSLDKADRFFADHGHISTFVGRLLPGIRQYISLPAGLARMNIPLFLFYTSLGSGIWVLVLALVGYWLGGNEAGMTLALHRISLLLGAFCLFLVGAYVFMKRRTRTADND